MRSAGGEGLIYSFGPYRLDLVRQELRRGEQVVALTPKAFDTLRMLVEAGGAVVPKEEILATVWHDRFVEESVLSQNVYTLRKVLDEGNGGRPYIVTVPRRGYRLGVPITRQGVRVFPTPERAFPVIPTTAGGPAPAPAASPPTAAPAPPELAASAVGRRQRRRLGVLFALLALVAAAAGWTLAQRRAAARRAASAPPAAAAPVRSIAVLPLLPLGGGDEDAEMLGLAMADALINRLSEMEPLVVRPTSAVQELRGRGRNPTFIGAQLGVDAVIDGSLQRAGDRLRVSLQLLRVPDGDPLWAGTFDTADTDPFAVQDAISAQVADGLSLRLSARRSRQLGTRGTADPEAYQEYVRGRYFWNRRTEADLRKAMERFRAAIERDPAFAAAHAGLADCWVLLPLYGNMPPREAFPRAIAAARAALELDLELAEAHTSLAYARLMFDWDWAAAEEEFRRAQRLDPNYPTAAHWHGYLLSALGRHEEAIAQARRAQELDPLSLVINADHGLVLYFARRHEEAIAQFQRTLELDPRFAYARFGLALAYAATGRGEDAVREAEQAVEYSGGSSVNQAALGYALGVAGRGEEARRVLAGLEERARRSPVQAGAFGLVHLGVGDRDRALDSLRRAYEERSRFVVFLQVWPIYDPLRGDPRFAALVRDVGLPGARSGAEQLERPTAGRRSPGGSRTRGGRGR